MHTRTHPHKHTHTHIEDGFATWARMRAEAGVHRQAVSEGARQADRGFPFGFERGVRSAERDAAPNQRNHRFVPLERP